MSLPAENIIPLPAPKPRRPSKWERTRESNLVRYAPTGAYYIRAKVHGRSFVRCLHTKSVEIARLKRDEALRNERARRPRRAGTDLTWADFAAEYADAVRADPDLKPRSRDYRLETLHAIRRTWEGIDGLPAASFTTAACEQWAKDARETYSATRFNGCLQTLRAVLGLAVKAHELSENPAASVRSASVTVREQWVPDSGQLKKLFAAMAEHGAESALLARFLAYFPFRIGTARQLRPEHVDRKRKEFAIPGELVKWGEPGRIYRPPIIPPMEAVLNALDRRYGKDRDELLPVKDCRKPLTRACAKLEYPRMTPHAFRHCFTTHCLLSGVDVRTVAEWRGDKDGGAMLLKIYAHLVDKHSRRMARKVVF